ncbi:MAG: phosphoserine phosphatase RsbU/P [Acidobacteriota bacterium]|jgi:sigma-B regulation protein RsbU (phosphoserine phosphatase)|nr:phosphoserine phosphatase RsbU/P [Acidobacteriota bacterium]
MPEQIENGRGSFKTFLSNARRWLRRVMPRVAMVAITMFFVRLFVSETRIYVETFVGTLFGFLTFVAILLTCLYYGLKALRWLKRKLLWRVRRRLMITYLFVGLTPIILLALLGLLFAFGGSAQGIARIITAQINATERQTQASARSLADSFERLPANADDRAIQAWLDERVALLRASLPGARAALWRGAGTEDIANVGQGNTAQFISETNDESTRGVGDESISLNAPLPDWLRGRAQWSGLSFTKPASKDDNFGTPSMRAVVRVNVNNRPLTLLLVVPVSRALVQQYRETTGIYVRPFFVRRTMGERSTMIEIGPLERSVQRRDAINPQLNTSVSHEQDVEKMFRQDQFGEKTADNFYIVVLQATDWASGDTSQHLSFLFDWSWALASKQFWGSSGPGEIWREALKYVAIAFLIFELLALIAAVWMTHAVTGTVHKLYSALDFIKRGDFSHRVKVRSHDQLGELASAFNEMSGNIEVLLRERVVHERLEREVEIAAEVQAQLFPRTVPLLHSAQIAAECRAARGVAGDYYDYIEIAPGLVALALGDVSGKGISASLVMSNLQASLRAQTTITAGQLNFAEHATAASVEASSDGGVKLHLPVVADALMDGVVARQMTNINRQLCQSTEANRFASLFLAIYEDRTRTLHYTNAGHNAPILVRADGKVERLTIGGMLVGAFDWAAFEEASTTVQPGDLLLVFSDGISEAESEAGVEYDEQRLTHFAVAHQTLSADELRHAIFEEIDKWSGTRERGDDQTLVIVKVMKV